MMQDRPDLLLSEMQGCSFDALEQVFPKAFIAICMDLPTIPADYNSTVWIVFDPAAGGPQSDYGIVSITRTRGTVSVRFIANELSTNYQQFLGQRICFFTYLYK